MYRYVADQESYTVFGPAPDLAYDFGGVNNVVCVIDSEMYAARIVARLNDQLQKLKAYSDELHLSAPITVERLIESHRVIRAARRALEKDSHEAFEDARQRAREFQEQAISYEYISLDKLKTMTLLEIANLVYEEES